MQAVCGHCGATVNLNSREGTSHVLQHAPRGSRDERMEQRRRTLDRKRAQRVKRYLATV